MKKENSFNTQTLSIFYGFKLSKISKISKACLKLILAFSLIFSLSACVVKLNELDNQKLTNNQDSTNKEPTKYLTFVADNIGVSKKIKSSETIKLFFNSEINIFSLDHDSIKLKIANSILDSNLYSVNLASNDQKQIQIKLLSKELQGKNLDAEIIIVDLLDAKNSPFKNGDKHEKSIKFKFIDSIAPVYLKNNLELQNKISSAKPLELFFSEKLNLNSINKQSVKLLKKSGLTIDEVSDDDYKVDLDEEDPTKIVLKLISEKLKNQTGDYQLEISSIDDLARNKIAETLIIEFSFLDSTRPIYIADNLQLLGTVKQIKSSFSLDLTFSKNLDSTSLTKNNLILQDEFARPIDKNKYQVEQDRQNKKIVRISLSDQILKSKTAVYKLKIQAIKDVEGNHFENNSSDPLADKNSKIIEFTFLDSVAPIFQNSNISNNSKKTNEVIILNFSEVLDLDSIKNITLKYKNLTDVERQKYKIEQNTNYKRQIRIYLLDEKLKNTSAEYLLVINSVKDLAGNSSDSTQIKFQFEDPYPPEFVSHNLTDLKKINSANNIELLFNEPLDADSLNIENISLQTQSGIKIESDKYQIKLDSANSNKVLIYLKDRVLKSKTEKYRLVIKGIKDLHNNILANQKTIDFTFVDSTKLVFNFHNLQKDATYKNATKYFISSNKSLILNFSKAILKSSIKDNIVLKRKLDNKYIKVELDKYAIEQNLNNPKEIEISLKDAALKRKTAEYKIEILANLQDNDSQKIDSIPDAIVFDFLDSIAPTYVTSNIETSHKINSENTIILEFSEILNTTSISKTNVILQDKKLMALSADKYSLEQNPTNKRQVLIKLLDEKLKTISAKYFIKIKDLEDLTNNKFVGIKTLEFEFLENVPPLFISSNIFSKKLVKNSSSIILNFNEELQSISATKVSVKKDGSDFNYFTSVLSDDKKSIVINFKDVNQFNLEGFVDYKVILLDGVLDIAGNELKESEKELSIEKIVGSEKIIYATPSGAGNQSGDTWSNAKTLQDAINASDAKLNNMIYVAKGSYYADLNKNNESAYFELKDGIEIYGGFDPNNPAKGRDLNSSIIEGDLGNGKHTERLFKGSNLSNKTILDGFVIQNAYNNKSFPLSGINNLMESGGILLKKSDIKLVNLTFKNNVLDYEWSAGGAIFIEDGSRPEIINSKFIGNSVKTRGGAIYIEGDSEVSIRNCVFENNKVANLEGGAIFNFKSDTIISNSSFINNKSKRGGAIFFLNEDTASRKNSIRIDKSKFIGNKADIDAGAIYLSKNINLISTSSLYKNNTSTENGGAIYSNKADLVSITDSKFENNNAKFGGALSVIDSQVRLNGIAFIRNGAQTGAGISYANEQLAQGQNGLNNLYISNALFKENRASKYGGAIRDASFVTSSSMIVNSTFGGNSADGFGGGIYISFSNPKIYNSIFWNNYHKQNMGAKSVNSIYNGRKDSPYILSNPIIENSILNLNSVLSIKKSQSKEEITDINRFELNVGNFKNNASSEPYLQEDLSLTSKSPAKDFGNNSLYLEMVNALKPLGQTPTTYIQISETDIAGNRRVDKQTGIIDAGAYELVNSTSSNN